MCSASESFLLSLESLRLNTEVIIDAYLYKMAEGTRLELDAVARTHGLANRTIALNRLPSIVTIFLFFSLDSVIYHFDMLRVIYTPIGYNCPVQLQLLQAPRGYPSF